MYEEVDPKKERVCILCRKAHFWRECLVHTLPATWTEDEWAALGTAQGELITALCQGGKGDKTVP
eukprot:10659803-Alexandrium_andersonii.AAC.1